LNFIGDVFQVPGKEREDQIRKYANEFEITNALGNLISSYSHGMKQKLAIISALIHKPKLLVLDEPFVGVDPKASLNLKNIMKEICREGSSVFFSTHVLEVAEKLCNKVAIINQGKLVACGETKMLLKDTTLENLFMEVALHEE
jgi:ABC-2 type transport system ATP-binding protein